MPFSMAEIARAHPGAWVAVQRGEVVMADSNPMRLVDRMRRVGITDATVFRCPHPDEPEIVGLG